MKTLTFFLIYIIPLTLFAQNNELIAQLEELKGHVGKVEVEKKSYEQELTFEKNTPYKVEILIRDIDSKGKTVEKRAVLNLGLLDKNLVKRESSKNLMWVTVKSGGMSSIKMYTDGALSDYTNVIELYSKDVDNARAIEGVLKTIIPLAEKEWKNSISLPNSYGGLLEWLSNSVKNVEVGDVTYKQSLTLDKENPTQVWLNIEESNAKGSKKVERIGWSLADLHEPSVSMRVRKNKVNIEATIRQNQDFVSLEEDGIVKGYTKNISFYADDVDQAQLFVLALRELIPLARTSSENQLPKPANIKEGFQLLTSLVKNFKVNEDSYEQSITEAQICTFTQQTSNAKASTQEEFIFDLSDLNEQSVAIKTSKQLLFVEAIVSENRSLIETRKNGEQQNYGKQVKFYVPDLNTAKQLHHVLSYVIKNSSKEVAPKDYNWLKTALADFDEKKLEIAQLLETREGEQCKLAYTTRKETNKKIDEHLYEFNLYDLDPNKMTLNVKGKTVEIALITNHGENIIKDYENGGKINYSKQISVAVPNIETGKTIMATMQKMVKDCSKK